MVFFHTDDVLLLENRSNEQKEDRKRKQKENKNNNNTIPAPVLGASKTLSYAL